MQLGNHMTGSNIFVFNYFDGYLSESPSSLGKLLLVLLQFAAFRTLWGARRSSKNQSAHYNNGLG